MGLRLQILRPSIFPQIFASKINQIRINLFAPIRKILALVLLLVSRATYEQLLADTSGINISAFSMNITRPVHGSLFRKNPDVILYRFHIPFGINGGEGAIGGPKQLIG